MASKSNAMHLPAGIGLNEFSALGRRAENFPVSALEPRAAWAVTCLDFGKNSVPNATAFAATPLNWTVTDINTATSPTIVGDANNGYVLINPGSKADSGYSLQANVANVVSKDLMRFVATPNTTLAAGREIVWGIRMGLQSAGAWDAKFFVGLALTDTAPVSNTTGAMGADDCIGFHCSEAGVISLVARENDNAETLALTHTPTTLGGGSLSTTLDSADFHDFVFYAKWNAAAATTGTDIVEAYIDGKYVGSVSGNSILPILTTDSLFNTIYVCNGPSTGIIDVGVVAIWNATKRYAQTQI